MFTIIAAVLLLVVIGAAAKYKLDASRNRKEVLTRMDESGLLDPSYSPTAELFKEVGIPSAQVVPEDGHVEATPTETPHHESAPERPDATQTPPEPDTVPTRHVSTSVDRRGLAELLGGFRPPVGLTSAGSGTPFETTFETHAQPVIVIAGLSEEFARLGCDVTWLEPNEAYLERNGARGMAVVTPADADDPETGTTAPTVVTLRAQ